MEEEKVIKIPRKYDRCVRKVKRQKSARNPYAVCSYLRAKSKRKTSIEEDILSWGEIIGTSFFAKGKKRKK